MRRLTYFLLVGASLFSISCGGKRTQDPIASRYELWNRLIQNGSNIILRVRDNSPTTRQSAGIGYIELSHVDPVTRENCRLTTDEFRVRYCCVRMLRAFMERSQQLSPTESPQGCLSRHFGNIVTEPSLTTLSTQLMGSINPDNYHFEHSPGRMALNPLITNPDDTYTVDTSVVIQLESQTSHLPAYADPTQGAGTLHNNIVGTWRITRVQTGL